MFLKMSSQNAGTDAISETQIKKKTQADSCQHAALGSNLRCLHTNLGGACEGKENGPFGSFAPPLKNP